MPVLIEAGDLVDVVQDCLIIRVENMRSIGMDIDAIIPTGVTIAANVSSLLDNQAAFSSFVHFMRKNTAKQSRADNQVIKLAHRPTNRSYSDSI